MTTPDDPIGTVERAVATLAALEGQIVDAKIGSAAAAIAQANATIALVRAVDRLVDVLSAAWR